MRILGLRTRARAQGPFEVVVVDVAEVRLGRVLLRLGRLGVVQGPVDAVVLRCLGEVRLLRELPRLLRVLAPQPNCTTAAWKAGNNGVETRWSVYMCLS